MRRGRAEPDAERHFVHDILRHVPGDARPRSLRDIAAAYGLRLEHAVGGPALIGDVGLFEHERDIAVVLAWDAIRGGTDSPPGRAKRKINNRRAETTNPPTEGYSD